MERPFESILKSSIIAGYYGSVRTCEEASMRKLTESQILSAFDSIDRPEVVKPNLNGIDWDSKDYFAWRDPSGRKTYMVVSLPERNIGLVFRADTPSHPG